MGPEQTDPRAARYARISEDKLGQEAGVTRQLADEQALADARKITVVATFTDNDLSATKGKPRPAYRELVAAIERGDVDTVLVYHLSRLWRNRRERAEGIETFKQHRVRILCVKGPDMDLSTAYGRGMVGLLGEFDTMEVEVKGERTVDAQRQKAAAGAWLGGTRPFGWRVDGGTVRRDPREAAAVRRATRDVIAGKPLAAIMRDLNDRGLTATTGRPFSYATVRQMLMRPRNAGIVNYGGEAVGEWPALVTEAQWRACRAILEDPGRRKSQSNKPRWLLTNILLCACGSPMRVGSTRVDRTTTQTRPVYRCYQKGKGRHASPDARTLDEIVSRIVVGRLERPDAVDLLQVRHRADAVELTTEAVALREELDELGRAHGRNEITLSQLIEATKGKKDQLARIEVDLEAAERRDVLGDIAGKPDAAKRWKGYTLPRKRAIVRELFIDLAALPVGRGNRWDPDKHLRIEWRKSTAE